MDIQRKAFEESNNVNPDWSFKFDEELQQYVAVDFEMTNQVDEFNEHWDTFRAGWDAAQAQAVPEWISTEDKEPVENGNYLVCIDGDVFYLTAKWVKNHFKFLARGYGLTEDFTDWRYCEGVKVTHWMLLPDSPKAQEPTND